jgi:hypothetical protein
MVCFAPRIPRAATARGAEGENHKRFVRTIKSECLNHLVLFGERHLRYVVREFMAHYHRERFHQALDGQLVEKQASSASDKRTSGKVVCRSRLGGILNFYHREAA